MRDRVRTIVVVTMISVIVWLFAEAESLTEENFPVSIVFGVEEGRGDVLVSTGPGFRNPVDIDVRGSRRAIGALRERALAQPIRVPPTTPLLRGRSGEVPVPIAVLLEQVPPFDGSGVRVLAAAPSTVDLTIVERRLVTIPVRPQVGGVDLEAEPVLEPASVQVWVPEAEADDLLPGLAAVARIDADVVGEGVDGGTVLREVAIELPPGLPRGVELLRDSVTAEFEVRSAIDSIALGSAVPVQVAIPPRYVGDRAIALGAETIPGVVLSGPRDVLEQIGGAAAPIVAVVLVVGTDLIDTGEMVELTKPITWYRLGEEGLLPLPAGVSVEAAQTTATLRIGPDAAS